MNVNLYLDRELLDAIEQRHSGDHGGWNRSSVVRAILTGYLELARTPPELPSGGLDVLRTLLRRPEDYPQLLSTLPRNRRGPPAPRRRVPPPQHHTVRAPALRRGPRPAPGPRPARPAPRPGGLMILDSSSRPRLVFAYQRGRITPHLVDGSRRVTLEPLPRRFTSLRDASRRLHRRFPEAFLLESTDPQEPR